MCYEGHTCDASVTCTTALLEDGLYNNSVRYLVTYFMGSRFLFGEVRIVNVYVPNNSAERKQFIKNLKEIIDENIIAGDFNCVNDSIIDRHPSHTTNDHGYNELIKLMNDFRKRHPDKRRFTFCRGQSKSRIDYFLIQNDLDCYVKNVSICYFPYRITI